MATNTSSMWKSKQVITAFVLGIVVAIFIGHAYVIYQTRNLALQNRADVVDIINFINQATGGAPATGTPTANGSIQADDNGSFE
ncbi:MAG: hypothetical protein WDZ73_00745 [Candidatus Paceibacterota bacterium]